MRTITATEAARGFSELLDRVERGETVVITRGGHDVAELRPRSGRTIEDLMQAIAAAPRWGEDMIADIEEAAAFVPAFDPASLP